MTVEPTCPGTSVREFNPLGGAQAGVGTTSDGTIVLGLSAELAAPEKG